MNDKMLEIGQKVFVNSMSVDEIIHLVEWDKHTDPIFKDYNFPILSNVEQIEWFKSKSAGKKRLFSIYNFQKQHIGYMSLRNVSVLFRNAELGIVLDPKYISQGYGKDSIRVLAKWYFEKLKYCKLYLTVALYNKRAMNCYKKIGFKYRNFTEEEYLNPGFDPFSDENVKTYSKYFIKKHGKIFSKCIKMYLTKEEFYNKNKVKEDENTNYSRYAK